MELYPTVTDSHTLQYDPAMFALRNGFLESVKPGTTVKETLVRHYASKSNQQVKTIWGLLIATIKSTFDDRGWDMQMLFLDVPPGLPIEANDIKRYLYAKCGNVGPEGEWRTMSGRKGSPPMNVREASLFFEKCRTWVAGQPWNIQVPDPDPNWREQ